MKNKYLILVFLLGLAGMLTIQSCTKDESPTPVIYKAAVAANPTPAEGDVVTLDGTSYVLKWEGTTTTSWDVYFGPAGGDLELVKTSLTGNTFTVSVEEGGAYEWYVETKDANGIVSNNISGPARDPWYFYINSAPTIPVLTAPLDEAVNVNVVGSLKWTATDAEDALTYNVFVGTSESSMAAVATGLTAASFVPTTLLGFTKYYWRVEAVDAHGATTSSVVHSFTTGKDVAPFVGKYLVDEPAEEYQYDINFAKGLPNTIVTTNYWNSGWTATFTLNFTKNTYTMTSYVFGAGWIGVESGTIDYATGGMEGEYSLWLNGVLQETGIHTYTKY